ncbi:hypothetical protein HZA75_07525 [Candidatus Roizmanbacteria bacterium]|nr:hypothetical protein [Candidatus Roizmanbacteria bacterium]
MQSVISTVQEWGRVIKNSGLITLTVGLTHGQLKITDNFYKAATPLYGIHFLSKETLRLIFQSAELEVKFGIARFDQKPHLYLYPNNLLMFLEAWPLGDKNQQNAENAQMLLSDAKFIYDTILSEKHLTPVGLEEIIRGILARDFVIKKSSMSNT